MSESMKFHPRFLTLRTFLATQPVLFGALLVLVLLIACEPYVPGFWEAALPIWLAYLGWVSSWTTRRKPRLLQAGGLLLAVALYISSLLVTNALIQETLLSIILGFLMMGWVLHYIRRGDVTALAYGYWKQSFIGLCFTIAIMLLGMIFIALAALIFMDWSLLVSWVTRVVFAISVGIGGLVALGYPPKPEEQPGRFSRILFGGVLPVAGTLVLLLSFIYEMQILLGYRLVAGDSLMFTNIFVDSLWVFVLAAWAGLSARWQRGFLSLVILNFLGFLAVLIGQFAAGHVMIAEWIYYFLIVGLGLGYACHLWRRADGIDYWLAYVAKVVAVILFCPLIGYMTFMTATVATDGHDRVRDAYNLEALWQQPPSTSLWAQYLKDRAADK